MPRGRKKSAEDKPVMTPLEKNWYKPLPLPTDVEYVDLKQIDKKRRAAVSKFTWDSMVLFIELMKRKYGITKFTKPVEKKGMWHMNYESDIPL